MQVGFKADLSVNVHDTSLGVDDVVVNACQNAVEGPDFDTSNSGTNECETNVTSCSIDIHDSTRIDTIGGNYCSCSSGYAIFEAANGSMSCNLP